MLFGHVILEGLPGGIWVESFLFIPSLLLFLVFPLPVLLYFAIVSSLLLPSFLGSLPSESGGVTSHFYSGFFSPDLTFVSEMRGDKRLKPQCSGSPHVPPLHFPMLASWGLMCSQHWWWLRTEQVERIKGRTGVGVRINRRDKQDHFNQLFLFSHLDSRGQLNWVWLT